jgi:hypothetical protein
MVQTWERSVVDDGFTVRRRHSLTAPDGTPLREHEWTRSGTDPYNFSFEKSKTLPGERTLNMSRTRSWDGTSGTMEQTFTGPNGQTRHFTRQWSPQEDSFGQPLPPPERFRLGPAAGGSGLTTPTAAPTPPLHETPKSRWGFLEKWNPFRGIAGPRGGSAARTAFRPPRAGFTVGSFGRSGVSRAGRDLMKSRPGKPQSNAQRVQKDHPKRPARPSPPRPRPGKTS